MEKQSVAALAEQVQMCSSGAHDVEAQSARRSIQCDKPQFSCSSDAIHGACTTCDVAAFNTTLDLEDAPPFSIRGYVAAVRELNLSKCWPFSPKLLEESIKEGKHPLLPPLSPCACVVQLRGEYYYDEMIGCAHEDMDEACGVNDGPQIQVQIDLSKCETELDTHARVGTTTPLVSSPSKMTKPPTDAAKSQEFQVPCSPHKQAAASRHAIPFLDGAVVFKKQTPRSIREIRKSVMQGCHCFKRTDTPICKNYTCSKSHAIPLMDSSDLLTLDSDDAPVCAGSVGCEKNYVADHENVSDITQQESSRNEYDAGNGISVIENSHFDVRPDTICKSSKDMKKDSHHSPPAANIANVPLHLQAEMWENAAFMPAHAISEYTTIRGHLSDSQSVDKSLESHSSKSSASRLCSDNMAQQDLFDRMPCLDNIPQQRCPVCLLFQSSSNTALNAHIDSCLDASSTEVEKTKSKQHKAKVRKKRSMAELCLVAPPCVNVDEVPSVGGRSKQTKDSTSLACVRRQKAIDRRGIQNTRTAVGGPCQQSKLRSQAKTLKFLKWRSRASSHEQQIPHGTSRRSAYHEGGIPNIKNKRFLGRTREWKTKSVLRKTRNWKRQKVNHESVTDVPHNALNVQDGEARKLGTILDRNSHNDDLLKDALPCRAALTKSKINKVSKTLQSKFLPKDLAALSQKQRKPQNASTQAAHIITSDTEMTVIGSRKTTLEFLQTDNHINDEVGQGVGNVEKVQFRVHIKPAKKRKNKYQESTTPDLNDVSDLQLAIIRIPSIPESDCDVERIIDRANTHLEHSPMQTCSGRAEVSLETEIPCQITFSKQGNSSPSRQRRVAEEWSLQDPSLPLFSSMIEERQGEARNLPNSESLVTSTTDNSAPPSLNCNIPKSSKSGGSKPFECASKCFRDMDNVSMLHLGPQPNRIPSLRKHPTACAAQAWHSLQRESGQTQEKDCHQAQPSLFVSTTLPDPNIASRQQHKRFPFSLCTTERAQWPRNFEQGNFLMAGSEDLSSSLPANHFIQPLQVAQITGMSAASNRSQEFAARQDTLRRDILIAEAGSHVTIMQQNAEAHQIDQSSTQSLFRNDHSTAQNTSFQTSSRVETWQAQNLPQKLPPWMQAAIQEQRSPAFSSTDFSTNSIGQSCALNATRNINTEASRGSSMFDMIGNPVLRLMGKTMVLMPQAQQGQVDYMASHINGQSNYINFLQSLDPGEVNHVTQWNESRVHTQPGIITQDYLSRTPVTHRNNGVQSWISSESRSIPQLQDFILRTPSSHGNFPLANQNRGFSQLSGRDIAAQDVNGHPSHPSRSPLLSATFHRAPTNWQHQNVKDSTPFQPNSGLFCQHTRMMSSSTFSEGRLGNSLNSVMPQVHANGCNNPMHVTKNVPNMMPQHPKTINSSPFPSWLSSISRTEKAHEPAQVIVLDDEDVSDSSTPGPSQQAFTKPTIPAAPQTQQSHLAEARATTSDSCHPAREKLKTKRFIPIIYTVGGSFGDSQFLPGVSGPKLQFRLARDHQCREVENSRTVLNTRKRLGSFEQQPEGRAKIVRTTGSPAALTRTDGSAACNIGPPKSSCTVKQIPSMEGLRVAAERMQGSGRRPAIAPPEMRVSRNASNQSLNQEAEQCQPAATLSKGSRSLPSQPTKPHAPTVGMCSTNMNPAEVDCQDAGQFMSTPSMSSSQAMPVHNGTDLHSSLNASNQPHPIIQTQEPGFASFPPTSSTINTQNADLPSVTPMVNMQGSATLMGPTPISLRSRNLLSETSNRKPGDTENTCLPMIYDSSKKPGCGTLSMVNTPFTLLPDGCPDIPGLPQECISSRIRSNSEATAPSHAGMQSLKVAGKFVIMNGRVSLMDVQKDKGSIHAHTTDAQNERGSASMHASVMDAQKEKEAMHAHGPNPTLNMSNNEGKTAKAPGNGSTRIRGCDDGLEAAALASCVDEHTASAPTGHAM